jgi:O-antigen/teichoic acid export membrane protein
VSYGVAASRPLGARILSAFGTSLLGILSGLLTNLWLIRHIAREIPPAEFGVYALVLQITAYLGTLQLGLDFAASRRIAERLGVADEHGASIAWHEVARFNRRVAVVAAAMVGVGAASLLSGLTWLPRESAILAGKLLLLTGSSQVALFLSRASYAALVGSQRQVVTNLLTVATSFGTTLLAFALLRLGLGVFAIPAAYLFWMTIAAGVLTFLARRWCAFITVAVQRDRRAFREMAGFGGLTTAGSVAWTVEVTSDVVVLGWIAGPAVVATYTLWWRFPAMIFDLCTRLVLSAFPGFAERHGQSEEHARALFGKVSQITSGLATLALVGIVMWLGPFVHLWIGAAYDLPNGRWVALLMALVVALRTLANLLSMFWLARGDARVTTTLGAMQAVVKLAVGIPLAWPFGIAGLLFGSCAASAVQLLGMATVLLKARMLDARAVLRHSALLGLALIPIVAAVGGWFPSSHLPSVMGFAVRATATAGAWGVVWLVWAWRGPLRTNLVAAARYLRFG